MCAWHFPRCKMEASIFLKSFSQRFLEKRMVFAAFPWSRRKPVNYFSSDLDTKTLIQNSVYASVNGPKITSDRGYAVYLQYHVQYSFPVVLHLAVFCRTKSLLTNFWRKFSSNIVITQPLFKAFLESLLERILHHFASEAAFDGSKR